MSFSLEKPDPNPLQLKGIQGERQLNLLDLRTSSSEREQQVKMRSIGESKKSTDALVSLTELTADKSSSKNETSNKVTEAESSPPNKLPELQNEKDIEKTAKEQEARLYPELAFSKRAADVLASVAGTAREKWDQANALFHVAEIQVEKYIDLQGGIQKMFHKVSQLADEIYNVMDNFIKGNRGLKIADGPEKPKQEDILRQHLKNLNKDERLAALRGEKGAALREGIFNICDDEEKDAFNEIDIALNKVQLHSSIKLQHALAANKYAAENNDINAKILSENILKSIAAVDPETYKNSPEIHGLILQSERGERMDLTEGKALSTALTSEAQKVIQMTLEGPDAAFDGDSRKLGAEQAAKFLAAALATNKLVCQNVWSSWDYAQKYNSIYAVAESLVSQTQQGK